MVVTWTYRILISCPGDVYNEFMPIIEDAVVEYNKQISNMQRLFEQEYGHRIAVEVLFWREDSHPVFLSGVSGQDVLNNQLVDEADGTIGLFYTKLGKPTEKYESGTVEEIERTLDRGKHVAVIPIVGETIPIKLLGDGQDYTKMKQYINTIRAEKRGLINDCSPERLKSTIMDQFNEIIAQGENRNNKYKTISIKE